VKQKVELEIPQGQFDDTSFPRTAHFNDSHAGCCMSYVINSYILPVSLYPVHTHI